MIATNTTLLSYPANITDYTNVRIEVVKKGEESNIYVANLYLDGLKVEESVPVNGVPEIIAIGVSQFAYSPYCFNGNMKNVKIYSK